MTLMYSFVIGGVLILMTAVPVFRERGTKPVASGTNIDQQQSSPDELKFQRLKAASGRTQEGADFSSQVYKSSDDQILSVRIDTFRSSRRAQRELTKLLGGARIIERRSRSDNEGKEIEQVVASFPARSTREGPAFRVLWRDNARLYSITASSLRPVLEFEKRFMP